MISAKSLVLLIATLAVLSVGAASTAFEANPNTDNPSGWGKLTSGAATTDQGSIGEHASNPPFEVNPLQGIRMERYCDDCISKIMTDTC